MSVLEVCSADVGQSHGPWVSDFVFVGGEEPNRFGSVVWSRVNGVSIHFLKAGVPEVISGDRSGPLPPTPLL